MNTDRDGEFVRWESGFRNWVTADGGPGPSGEGGFRAEPGRYHLYVSLACPWAHRTLIFRVLKGLEDLISVSVVHPLMPPESWVFGEYPGATPDAIHGFDKLHQLYEHAAPGFDGVVTVPVLYDRQRDTIVNNESSEIIRMLNGAFDAWGRADLDFYPRELREGIDAINALVYQNVNNGVYRAGFATTQRAYEAAFDRLFDTLDELEDRLARQRYLVGERMTEADYAYGTEPNDFLAAMGDRLPRGSVLCLGEGEGRNAVWLAQWGHDVTAVDASSVALEKAQRLAASRGVTIRTVHADLAAYHIEPGALDAVVSIFCHLPPDLRADVHRRSVAGLREGGMLLLEAYTPRQLALATGGPPVAELMMDAATLRTELASLDFLHLEERDRDIHEGVFHDGPGAVVQVLARKSRGPQ